MGVDDVVVILRAGVGSLVIDHDFGRALSVEKLIDLEFVGLVAEDGVLSGAWVTLTWSSLSPKESAMHPLIHRNFLESSLFIQIKKVIFLIK